MKKILTIAYGLSISIGVAAQWLGTNPVYFNSGNVGIGTSSPGVWFGSKTLEFSDSRPVLKLSSTSPTGLSTIVFTNSTVDPSTHFGEFHLNYQFNQVSNDKSNLSFGSYPGSGNNGVFTLQADGNVGVGTASPRGQFDVAGTADIYLVNSPITGTTQSAFLPGHIYFSPYSGTDWTYLQARRSDNSGSTNLRFRTLNASAITEAMSILSNGDVGIGTTSPDATLAVKGQIHAQEVKVDLNGAVAPDYVFNKDYQLTSLDSIKNYIDQNKHLPEVPSAKEMEKNGVQLGEMNMLLLKKIEELTLHLIAQQKQIDELKQLLKK